MSAYSDTLWLVKTLAERLQHVMAATGLNPSSWAKLADVPRATVRLAIKHQRDSMESRTLAALASAAEVSFEWLATGSYGPGLPDDARYPSRPRALAAGRLAGYSKATLAAIAGIDTLDHDPGMDYWIMLLLTKHLENAEAPRLLAAKPDENPR